MSRYYEQILFVTFVSLLIIGIYVTLARYNFGAATPCGILEAHMRPYRIELEIDAAFEIERKHSLEGEATQFRNPEIRRLLAEDRKRIDAAPETATRKLREEIAELNIAQCAWRAVTWDAPPSRSGGQRR